MMPVDNPVVFLVEDDTSVRKTLKRALEQHDLTVREYAQAETFLQDYGNEKGCLLQDLHMPNMNGLELQAELKRRNISIPIIFISGNAGHAATQQALQAGAAAFLHKPFTILQLLENIDFALQQYAKN